MLDTRIVCVSLIAAWMVLLSSCTKVRDVSKPLNQPYFSAGSPMADSISFRYAVYRLPGSRKEPLAVLRQELVKNYPNLTLVIDVPKEPKGPVVCALVQKEV